MNIGERLWGFTVKEKEYIKEADGSLFTLFHEGSGARLAYLDREDENKTFAIAFKTPPEDDTGVFHIIEHSVLNGSRKFPVKEPFVELLKGSLNTFLNALTYEDRTVYPVSSRCDKDFYNLTDVYLDAVFHPLMKENPFIFMQEGWHYEYDCEKKSLSYNGVVYNEMKGAYSSPEELGYSTLCKLLYNGSSYGKDSGGDPDHIPELTYEKFCEMHNRYYHPSNAYIYLDGSVRLDEILPLIDSYLSEFQKKEMNVAPEAKCPEGERRAVIEYDSTGSENSGARLLLGYSFSDFRRTDEKLLSSLIISYLSSSNDSPLTKAILDSGLCEDITLSANYSRVYTLSAEIKGFDKENESALVDIFYKTIEKEIKGMDREALHANLNRTEFKLRERDLGSLPVGIANAFSVYELWSYGAKPSNGLVFEDDLAAIRRGIDEGLAERMLDKMIPSNKSRAAVLMLPSESIAKENDARIARILEEKLSSLKEDELSELIRLEKDFKNWQESEDSEKTLECLPKLSLSEVTPKNEIIPTKTLTENSATVIRHTLPTRGIVYLTMFFDCSDLSESELPLLSVLAASLANLATENYSPLAIKSEIKKNLGSLSFSTAVINNSKAGRLTPTLRIFSSALLSKSEKIREIILEIMTKTRFENAEAVKKILVQTRLSIEESFVSNGESAAMSRLEAMSSAHGKVSELLHGYEYYLSVKSFIKEIEDSPEKFMEKLLRLCEKIFTKERLIISTATDTELTLDSELISKIPKGEPAERKGYEKNPVAKEAISIPSKVGYATAGLCMEGARDMLGALRVVRSILSYEYLWNNVRVKGGAYGAGFVTRRDTGLFFYSYRDPSPKRSLDIFRGSSEYLLSLADEGADLTKFIIGAYGEYDVIKTPRTAAAGATADILTDWTEEDELKLREGMLKTSRDDLRRVAGLLSEMFESAGVAVAAPVEMLDKFDEKFDKVITL